MPKVTIHHAFDGFLYAPLFLAEDLGLFPNDTHLNSVQSDIAATDVLITNAPGNGVQLAICDPFSVNLSRSNPNERNDYCVVGSLINVLPLWVYNSDPTTEHVKSEEHLSSYQDRITKIICYPDGTTGHVVAQRVCDKMKLPQGVLSEASFGQEFKEPPDSRTCVVTADVLRLASEGVTTGNTRLIFNYAARAPVDLMPFLFTGILTLEKTVERGLVPVLAVLDAIREAIHYLNQEDVKPLYVEKLIVRFTAQLEDLGLHSHAEKERVVRASLDYLKRENIYERDLQPEIHRLDDAWNNASEEWKRRDHRRTYPSVDEKYDRLPSLLVRPTWRPALKSYYEDVLEKETPTALDSLVSLTRSERFSLLFAEIGQLPSVLLVVEVGRRVATAIRRVLDAHPSPTTPDTSSAVASMIPSDEKITVLVITGLIAVTLYVIQFLYFWQLSKCFAAPRHVIAPASGHDGAVPNAGQARSGDCKQEHTVWQRWFIFYITAVLGILALVVSIT